MLLEKAFALGGNGSWVGWESGGAFRLEVEDKFLMPGHYAALGNMKPEMCAKKNKGQQI